MATIATLIAELVTLTKTVSDLVDKSYSVFNVEELEDYSRAVDFPLAGVSYEGTTPQDNIQGTAKRHSSAIFVTTYFTIIVGVNYRAGTGVDTKVVATDLLDGVRSAVLGYQGVNTRPWRFSGEQPLPTDLEGVIFYGQMWETDLPVIQTLDN